MLNKQVRTRIKNNKTRRLNRLKGLPRKLLKTGNVVIDTMLNGGFRTQSTVAVIGSSGSYKSGLAQEMLLGVATNNIPRKSKKNPALVYISFEPLHLDKQIQVRQETGFGVGLVNWAGMPDLAGINGYKVIWLEMEPYVGSTNLIKTLEELSIENDIAMLVIDGIEIGMSAAIDFKNSSESENSLMENGKLQRESIRALHDYLPNKSMACIAIYHAQRERPLSVQGSVIPTDFPKYGLISSTPYRSSVEVFVEFDKTSAESTKLNMRIRRNVYGRENTGAVHTLPFNRG